MFETIDSLFVNGLLSTTSTLGFTLLLIVILNVACTKLIKKKWADPKVYLRLKKYVLILIFLTTFLSQIKGLDSLATTLLASGGMAAILVGLACQEAASSMINGMLIFTYKPYLIGDTVYVVDKNIRGKVFDITLRHTVIETLEKTQVIIPNTIMNSAVIENISNIESNKANHLLMDISYDSDIHLASKIMQDVTRNHPLCVDQRTPEEVKEGVEQIAIHCLELKDSSICLRATIFTKDGPSGFQLLSDCRIKVKEEFDRQGVSIPYPHVVVKQN
ncbi:mechanosensitive ion channel family protein [Tannockella kyphosi]|uniref:mechanosensitive ion channel family protein n=1 Tax=Tannockella kyphosi TaxID=2899121 RepID=UPI002010F628|nr:mechanosensitive ion channel domain-containing protein [Tannockella kyphosi]